jgi:hypothetical protein
MCLLSSSTFLLMIVCMHLIVQKKANFPFHLLGFIHYSIHVYACFIFCYCLFQCVLGDRKLRWWFEIVAN